MAFHYRDPDGDLLRVAAANAHDGAPVVVFQTELGAQPGTVHVPLDRVEEVVAGIRNAAREASTLHTVQVDIHVDTQAVQDAIRKTRSACGPAEGRR